MNVLCLGAGSEQCYSIKKAQELGLNVIAIDQNPYAKGLKIANIGIPQDIKEIDKVIDIARKYNIKSVIPTPIGKYLTIVGAVNDALALNGISYDGAVSCTDKVICTEKLQKEGVLCAKQIFCENESEIRKVVKKIGVPCILKPRQGSGSRGVISILEEKDINKNILKHVETKGIDHSIVEEFIEGKEYGVDGIIINGKFSMILIREKIMTTLPYRQEVGYFSPVNLKQEQIQNIVELILKACKALNINNCIINADVIMNNENKPYLVEIAGRPAGYNMNSFFIPYVTGIDLISEGIRLSLGKEVLIKKSKKLKPLVYHFLNLKKGYLSRLPNNEDFVNDNIVDYEINIKIGNYIEVVKSGSDIIHRGFIAATGNDIKEAMESCNILLSKFVIE